MAHIRCELECGRDVVVLVDSITRMVRAFNLRSAGAKWTMSGGIDAKALVIPRRFFGLARNIETWRFGSRHCHGVDRDRLAHG